MEFVGRIRTIKPEFPQSETVGRQSREARLCFLMLFTIADDEGRCRAASRMLASILYPYDDDAATLIDDWLDELELNGMVRRYTVDGSTYLEIVKWLDHQKIDKPSKSRLPAPTADPAAPREVSRNVATDLVSRIKDQDKEKVSRSKDRPVSEPSRFDEFWKAYPRRDGPNPRKPAETRFNALVKTGLEPAMLIAEAKKLADAESARGNIGTRFIPQAVTWLNQQRWSDHAAVAFLVGDKNAQANRAAKPETLGDIAGRHAESGISFGPRPTGLPEPQGATVVRLLPQG